MARKITPKTARRITDDRDRALYVISIAAELAGVHPQTLRFYERRGLVSPKRSTGNSRRYSDHDIERVRLIQSMTQQQGMNLAAVEAVIGLQGELEKAQDRLARLQREVDEARERLDEEVERVRRSFKAELVPLKDVQSPLFGGGAAPR
jgi:MerR family transcriptional regulator/heat shock protein HspR